MIGKEEGQTFPFLNYPSLLDCLGIRPQSPKLEIKEGFMRLSYDLHIKPADDKCLFAKPEPIHDNNRHKQELWS